MSDTPETDAAALASDWGWSLVLKETCRRLERERDKAEAGWSECREFAQRVVDERDEAREALRVLFKDYKELADSGDAGFWDLEDKDAAQPALKILRNMEALK